MGYGGGLWRKQRLIERHPKSKMPSIVEAYIKRRTRCFSTMSGMPEVPLPWRALVQKLLRPAAGPFLLPKVKQMANSFTLRRCLQLS